MLAKVGMPASEVTVRTGPELGFLLEGGGKTGRAQYDLATGALAGRPEEAPGDPLSTRRFLTRLHMAHGFPAQIGARWGWAIAVDLMFASMIGWGITGLLMWWQMKNVRRIGLVVLAPAAAWGFVAMYGALLSLVGLYLGHIEATRDGQRLRRGNRSQRSGRAGRTRDCFRSARSISPGSVRDSNLRRTHSRLRTAVHPRQYLEPKLRF